MSDKKTKEYYISYSLTSQTLVFQGRTPEKNYRYTYMAFFVDTQTGKDDYGWALKNFGIISNKALNEIFECKEVSNIEVSRDNISKLYTLRFCSSKELHRRYILELEVEDKTGTISMKKVSEAD